MVDVRGQAAIRSADKCIRTIVQYCVNCARQENWYSERPMPLSMRGAGGTPAARTARGWLAHITAGATYVCAAERPTTGPWGVFPAGPSGSTPAPWRLPRRLWLTTDHGARWCNSDFRPVQNAHCTEGALCARNPPRRGAREKNPADRPGFSAAGTSVATQRSRRRGTEGSRSRRQSSPAGSTVGRTARADGPAGHTDPSPTQIQNRRKSHDFDMQLAAATPPRSTHRYRGADRSDGGTRTGRCRPSPSPPSRESLLLRQRRLWRLRLWRSLRTRRRARLPWLELRSWIRRFQLWWFDLRRIDLGSVGLCRLGDPL